MFLPLLVFVCAFLRPDQTWKKILLRLCLPAPLMGALLLFYFSLQSPIRDRPRIVGVPAPFAGMSARDFVGQQARFLFPGYWEFLSAVIFLSLLVWIWVGEGATKRLIFLILAFVATIFILDGLLGGNYGYYPRHIVMAFFLTSCGLMALIQDRFATREAINAHGARSP
jgi:hypothetical protein